MRYIRALDGLRGLSILLVMSAHTQVLLGGFLGVDLFFVLSGFLISTSLIAEFEKHGSVSYRSFYMRRVLKLFPVLFLVVSALLIGIRVFDPSVLPRFSNATVASILLFYSNWAYLYIPTGHHVLAQTWSLGIEEQFYLLFPWLFVWLLPSSVSDKRRVAPWVLGIALSLALKWLILKPGDDASFSRVYYGTDTRMDGLFLGVLTALLASAKPASSLWRWREPLVGTWPTLLSLGALLTYTLGLTYETLDSFYYGFNCLYAFCAGVLVLNLVLASSPEPVKGRLKGGGGSAVGAGVHRLRRLLEWAPLVQIGKMSYTIYVVHFVFTGERNNGWIKYVLERWEPVAPYVENLTWTPFIALEWAVALVASVVVYYAVERPGLALKSRFYVRSSAANASQGAASSNHMRNTPNETLLDSRSTS